MKEEKTIFSKQHRQHIAKALSGVQKSPEHRAKIAEGMQRAWDIRRGIIKNEPKISQI